MDTATYIFNYLRKIASTPVKEILIGAIIVSVLVLLGVRHVNTSKIQVDSIYYPLKERSNLIETSELKRMALRVVKNLVDRPSKVYVPNSDKEINILEVLNRASLKKITEQYEKAAKENDCEIIKCEGKLWKRPEEPANMEFNNQVKAKCSELTIFKNYPPTDDEYDAFFESKNELLRFDECTKILRYEIDKNNETNRDKLEQIVELSDAYIKLEDDKTLEAMETWAKKIQILHQLNPILSEKNSNKYQLDYLCTSVELMASTLLLNAANKKIVDSIPQELSVITKALALATLETCIIETRPKYTPYLSVYTVEEIEKNASKEPNAAEVEKKYPGYKTVNAICIEDVTNAECIKGLRKHCGNLMLLTKEFGDEFVLVSASNSDVVAVVDYQNVEWVDAAKNPWKNNILDSLVCRSDGYLNRNQKLFLAVIFKGLEEPVYISQGTLDDTMWQSSSNVDIE